MNSFVYDYPVKNYFGDGAIEQALAAEMPAMGEKILIAYGGGSVKRSGLYAKIVAQLKEGGKDLVDFPGIMPNPTYEKVQEGAKLARTEHVDYILAVGGGSVFDCCKIITVIPFCTSASSPMDESGTLLAEMAGTGDWQEGQRFQSSVDESEVREWVSDLGIE